MWMRGSIANVQSAMTVAKNSRVQLDSCDVQRKTAICAGDDRVDRDLHRDCAWTLSWDLVLTV